MLGYLLNLLKQGPQGNCDTLVDAFATDEEYKRRTKRTLDRLAERRAELEAAGKYGPTRRMKA